MSIDLGTMGAKVNLVTRGFDRGVKRVAAGFKNMGQKAMHLNQTLELVGRGFRMMERSVKTAIGPFVEAADKAERYAVTLNVLLGSQKEGARMFDEMSRFAAKVPFEYEKIMSSATALAGVMEGGVDEVTQWMPMITDLAAVSRLSIEETTGQIIRMYSAGASAADLFRERGILAMLGFKAGVRYTAEETKEMLNNAFESPTSKFRGASAKLAKTWTGLLSMLSDRWFIFRNKVMNGGLFDGMKKKVNDVLTLLDKFQTDGTLERWAQNTAKALKSMINSMITFVRWSIKGYNAIVFSFKGIGYAFNEAQIYLVQIRLLFQRIFTSIAVMANNLILDILAAIQRGLNKIGAALVEFDNPIANKTREAINSAVKGINGGIVSLFDSNMQLNSELAKTNFELESHVKKRLEILEGAKEQYDILQGKGNLLKLFETGIGDINKSPESKSGVTGTRGTTGQPTSHSETTKKAIAELQQEINQLTHEKMSIGMAQYVQEIMRANYEADQLGKKYEKLSATNPEIADMVERVRQLKYANIDAAQSWEKQMQNMQRFSDNLNDVLSAMEGPLADFFQTFAQTGKMAWGELVSSLIESLQIFAAQKTAHLLMEAAYHGVMAYADPYSMTNAGIPHAAAAAQALQGAAIMGSFIAGSGLAGMAHSGITSIPEDGTWLLQKNERVVDSKTNEDLKSFLDGGGGGVIIEKIEINNSDEKGVMKALPQLEKTIKDVVVGNVTGNGQIIKAVRQSI